MMTHPCLPIEDRSSGVQLDQQGNQSKDGGQQHQSQERPRLSRIRLKRIINGFRLNPGEKMRKLGLSSLTDKRPHSISYRRWPSTTSMPIDLASRRESSGSVPRRSSTHTAIISILNCSESANSWSVVPMMPGLTNDIPILAGSSDKNPLTSYRCDRSNTNVRPTSLARVPSPIMSTRFFQRGAWPVIVEPNCFEKP